MIEMELLKAKRAVANELHTRLLSKGMIKEMRIISQYLDELEQEIKARGEACA